MSTSAARAAAAIQLARRRGRASGPSRRFPARPLADIPRRTARRRRRRSRSPSPPAGRSARANRCQALPQAASSPARAGRPRRPPIVPTRPRQPASRRRSRPGDVPIFGLGRFLQPRQQRPPAPGNLPMANGPIHRRAGPAAVPLRPVGTKIVAAQHRQERFQRPVVGLQFQQPHQRRGRRLTRQRRAPFHRRGNPIGREDLAQQTARRLADGERPRRSRRAGPPRPDSAIAFDQQPLDRRGDQLDFARRTGRRPASPGPTVSAAGRAWRGLPKSVRSRWSMAGQAGALRPRQLLDRHGRVPPAKLGQRLARLVEQLRPRQRRRRRLQRQRNADFLHALGQHVENLVLRPREIGETVGHDQAQAVPRLCQPCGPSASAAASSSANRGPTRTGPRRRTNDARAGAADRPGKGPKARGPCAWRPGLGGPARNPRARSPAASTRRSTRTTSSTNPPVEAMVAKCCNWPAARACSMSCRTRWCFISRLIGRIGSGTFSRTDSANCSNVVTPGAKQPRSGPSSSRRRTSAAARHVGASHNAGPRPVLGQQRAVSRQQPVRLPAAGRSGNDSQRCGHKIRIKEEG